MATEKSCGSSTGMLVEAKAQEAKERPPVMLGERPPVTLGEKSAYLFDSMS